LYPTIHLAYKVKNGELQLNYSKRVNRPDGDQLNPFPEYIDPLNLSAGNPYLEPEYIHSLELGYQIKAGKYSIVPSIYYRYKYNGFTSIIKPINDSVLLRTEENLASDQSAGLEIIFSARPSKYFNANLSTNVFYNTINAENLGFSNKKSIFSMNTNINLNFNFTKTTMFQASANYRSKRQTPQGLIYPAFVINFGARQDLFKAKLSVTATLSDAFKTLRQKSILDSPELYQVSVNTRDSRVFYIGLNYRFGVGQKKKDEKIQYDDNL
jgi:outer membrane receptor protein involved in Fe transport